MKECRRKKGESFDAFLRRVRLELKKGGLVSEVRRRMFRQPKSSRNLRQKRGAQRAQHISKQNYLIRTGKLPDPEDSFNFGR